MYNKILITGGGGFVGKNFDTGIKLRKEDCNLLDFNETLRIFQDIKPDAIIHSAGRVGGVWGNMREKGRYCYENVQINTNVLEAARLVGVQRVLSYLSTCGYPVDGKMPYTEDQFNRGMPHEDHFGYAFSKRLLAVMSRAYSQQYGVIYNCLVPSNIYGPHDNYGLETGHVTPTLIARCYEAKKNNVPFVVWGSGKPRRELIYVEDIVKMTLWALDNYLDIEEPLNAAGQTTLTIEELANLIVKYTGFTGKMVWDRSRPDGQAMKATSMEKFKRLYPDFKFITPEEGLAKTIEWYRSIHE